MKSKPKKKTKNKSEWKKIGEFAVDSGTFLICDPCYLIEENTKEFVPEIQKEYYKQINSKKENICMKFPENNIGCAVMGSTKIGDGIFNVYQRKNPDGQKELRIIFT